jgi:steroid delta-isomerase-like uncharacterized protein
MSASANKETVRRFQEAFSRGDLDGCLACLAPDVVVHFPGAPGPLDRDSYRAVGAMFLGAFPDLHLVAQDLIGEGDMVACRERLTGTHQGAFQGIPATGRPVTIEGITIDHMRDGQIVARHVQFDAMGLMQQLGALPAPPSAAEAAR